MVVGREKVGKECLSLVAFAFFVAIHHTGGFLYLVLVVLQARLALQDFLGDT
jgi:hypothetical protein